MWHGNLESVVVNCQYEIQRVTVRQAIKPKQTYRRDSKYLWTRLRVCGYSLGKILFLLQAVKELHKNLEMPRVYCVAIHQIITRHNMNSSYK